MNTKSASRPIHQQYHIPPPNVPAYFYGFSKKAWKDLMVWSWNEYQARLNVNAKKGYVREFTRQAREYSPERVLAEMTGYRDACSRMSPAVWRGLSKAQRDYLIRCLELRELLIRQSEA